MSIDRISISNSAIDRANKTQGADDVKAKGEAQRSQQPASTDSVVLSSAAKDAERLTGKIEDSTADRLEEVRAALASGTYRVSGQDIAKKLIEFNKR